MEDFGERIDANEGGRLRDRLVEQLRHVGALSHPAVADAFGSVPRHLFLPDRTAEEAYRDQAFVTKLGPDGQPISSSSQPAIMAVMLEQLEPVAGQRVLEIGTGTGYNAALLAHLVGAGGSVVSVDIDQDLIDAAGRNLRAAGYPGVELVCADGAYGHPDRAPYDRIILTVGAWDIAPAWLDQLAPDGRLVLPLSLRGVQRSVAFERAAGALDGVSVRDCGFMRLRGAMAGPETTAPLGADRDVVLHRDDDRPVDTDALSRALAEPGEDQTNGVSITVGDAFGGLGLWLALHEPDIAQLTACGAAAERIPSLLSMPGHAHTAAVLGVDGLALLLRPDGADPTEPFPVTARGFGPHANALAARLLRHARDWDTAGRPATQNLQITAHPAGADLEPGTTTIDKQHTRLVLSWH